MLPSATSCVYNGKLPPCGLLYVSSYYTNDVFVFKNNALVGKLTGFNAPDGVCTDKSGNVWITNNRGQSIVEYAHGGSTPIKTLSDPGVYPLGCAVNPRTGAIAVTNVFTTGSGQGNVAIYHKASGKPLILTDPDIYDVYFCGFDAQSNLYIDGLDTSGNFEFAELPRDRLQDLLEMQRCADRLQNVDDRREVVALARELADARFELRDLWCGIVGHPGQSSSFRAF